MFQGLVFRHPLAAGTTVGVGVITPELLERLTFRADVLVVLRVPIKVSAGPCAILTSA